MEQLPGTAQAGKYVWQARKPFRVPGGHEVKQGETFTPTVEMIAAFGDLMVKVGVAERFQAADARITAAKDEVAKAEAEKAEARAQADAEPEPAVTRGAVRSGQTHRRDE